MQAQDIQDLLTQELELDEVHVSANGSHFQVIAVASVFEGMSRVKQQQYIYAPLAQHIADNTVHAVSIKAFTPQRWQKEKMFNMPSKEL